MAENVSNPLVSVIVPVYNVEQYLAKCLDSLARQTLPGIEVLAVNDGSTDNSQAIIDEYAARYPDKIIGLAKPNGGAGSARNFGMAHARGDYIGFVDGDDFVNADMFRDLYDSVTRNDCEAAICAFKNYVFDGAYRNYAKGGVYPFERDTVYCGRDFLLENKAGVCWNILYKKSIIAGHPFPDLWLCEDAAWLAAVMTRTARVCYVPRAHYHWVRRESSATMSKSNVKTLDAVRALEYALEHAHPDEKDAAAFYVARKITVYLRVRPGFSDAYVSFANRHKETLLSGKYLCDHPEVYRAFTRCIGVEPIPKVLYYDNFGGTPITEQERRRVEAWRETLVYGDGETVCLNEDNCDVRENPAVSALYDRGEYGLVGHYFKLKQLLERGGLGLRTTMEGQELIVPLLCQSRMFFALAADGRVQDGLYAAAPGQERILRLLDALTQIKTGETARDVFGAALLREAQTAESRETPEEDEYPFAALADGTRIYDPGVFTCDFRDGRCIARDVSFLDEENDGFQDNAAYFMEAWARRETALASERERALDEIQDQLMLDRARIWESERKMALGAQTVRRLETQYGGALRELEELCAETVKTQQELNRQDTAAARLATEIRLNGQAIRRNGERIQRLERSFFGFRKGGGKP